MIELARDLLFLGHGGIPDAVVHERFRLADVLIDAFAARLAHPVAQPPRHQLLRLCAALREFACFLHHLDELVGELFLVFTELLLRRLELFLLLHRRRLMHLLGLFRAFEDIFLLFLQVAHLFLQLVHALRGGLTAELLQLVFNVLERVRRARPG